ncbi:MAG: DUF1570 domain-containing protein [Phycisphaerales bacterium]|nr:DUF1570 domain-containing protein [Phycisphaerales bacterium]
MARTLLLLVLAIVLGPMFLLAKPPLAQTPSPPGMKRYDGRYYIIYTDWGEEFAREAILRTDAMAEEYYQRTREFSGQLNARLPVYLFSSGDDYFRAGAPPSSGGVFMGDRIMAQISRPTNNGNWRLLQHEGFHHFMRATIDGDIPAWLSEGFAEYFVEALFTGDGFVSGLIPPERLKRVRDQIQQETFLPLSEMLIDDGEQYKALGMRQYDQGWAMVHFLAHGENGRYQKAFTNFLKGINNRLPWRQAWIINFGGIDGIQEKFNAYWLNLPDNPTQDLYVKATALTLASFLARAYQQGQTFDSLDTFLNTARSGKLKVADELWLPPGLLYEALKSQKSTGQWSWQMTAAKLPRLVAVLPDKTRIIASFDLKHKKIQSVQAQIDILPRLMAQARELQRDGRTSDARRLLSAAIKANPQSEFVAEARKLVQELK